MIKTQLSILTTEELDNNKFNNYFKLDIIAEDFVKSEIEDQIEIKPRDVVVSSLNFEISSDINLENLQIDRTLTNIDILKYINCQLGSRENEILIENIRSGLENNFELIVNNTLIDEESFDFNTFYSIILENIKTEIKNLENKLKIIKPQLNEFKINEIVINSIDILKEKISDKTLSLDNKILIYKSDLGEKLIDFKNQFKISSDLDRLISKKDYKIKKMEYFNELLTNGNFKENQTPEEVFVNIQNLKDNLSYYDLRIQVEKETTIASYHYIIDLIKNADEYLGIDKKEKSDLDTLNPYVYKTIKQDMDNLIKAKGYFINLSEKDFIIDTRETSKIMPVKLKTKTKEKNNDIDLN